MVANQKRAVASSEEGALLIDDLTEWLDAEIDADPLGREVRRAHPSPERLAAQIALGYFLPYPTAPRVDFEPREAAARVREPGLGPGARTSPSRPGIGVERWHARR